MRNTEPLILSHSNLKCQISISQGCGGLHSMAARLLSSAPGAQNSGQPQQTAADAAAAAPPPDRQDQQSTGTAPVDRERQSGTNGAGGSANDDRRKRSRFYRDQQVRQILTAGHKLLSLPLTTAALQLLNTMSA